MNQELTLGGLRMVMDEKLDKESQNVWGQKGP